MNNLNHEVKKPFDSTICFTFFGTWAEAIIAIESEADRKSDAYMLFKAIAEYNLYGVLPNFDRMTPSMKALWIVVEREADASISRRKRGFATEEPSEEHQTIIDTIAENPDASVREIAEMLGVGKSTVQRVKVKYGSLIKESRDALRDDEPYDNQRVVQDVTEVDWDDREEELPF